MKTRKYASLILIFVSCLSGLMLSNHKVSADVYDDAYRAMSPKLPDDNYSLYKNGSRVSSSTDCLVPEDANHPKGKWGCTTGNYGYFDGDGTSHDYITLARNSINDDRNIRVGTGPYKYANTTEIEIYTQSPSAKEIHLTVVNRGIGEDVACHNYITAYYHDGDTGGTNGGSSFIHTNGCVGDDDSSGSYSFPRLFPADKFTKMYVNGKDTGIWRGKMVLSFTHNGNEKDNPENGQISFHISSPNGARFGYMGLASELGPNDPLGGAKDGEHAWVNVYPTNYAKDHKVRFYFRPNCDAKTSDDINLTWDDLNANDNGNIQRSTITARVYKFRPDHINEDLDPSDPNKGRVVTWNGLIDGTDGRTIHPSTYAPNQQYSFMVEFDGIDGGNGMSFQYPFDSGDARIPCGEVQTDQLKACSSTISFVIPSNGVSVRVYALKDNWSSGKDPLSSTYSDKVYDKVHNATNELKLPEDVGLDKLVSNNGFQILVKPLDSDGNTVGGNDEDGPDSSNRNLWSGTCFHASCTMSVVPNIDAADPDWPDGAVKASKGFKGIATITNTDNDRSIPATIGTAPLGITDFSGSIFDRSHSAGGGIGPGGHIRVTVSTTAQGTIGTETLAGYPDFYGKFRIGSDCTPASVNVYQKYDFTPTYATTFYDDNENPKGANFHFTMTQDTGSVGVHGTITRDGYRRRPAGSAIAQALVPVTSESDDYGNFDKTDTYSFAADPVKDGDKYCGAVSLDRGHGWRGPASAGANEYLSNSSASITDCGAATLSNPIDELGGCDPLTDPRCPDGGATVVDQPYVKVFGTDVAAGGGFGQGCSATPASSNIVAFMRPINEQVPFNAADREHTGKSGSGTQLAALALGDIKGFTSASSRRSPPTILNGLTFSNVAGAATPGDLSPTLGGKVESEGWCVPDYFGETQYPDGSDKKRIDNSATTVNVADPALQDGKQSLYLPGSPKKITLTNSAGTYAKHHTIYVEGDVNITNNVAYIADYTGKLDNIPSFTLVVKGNIYIDHDVSQLDGVYIAQPDSRADSGRIYTCAVGGVPVTTAAGLYTDCGASAGLSDRVDCNVTSGSPRQLIVNGAFIAQRVVLNRTGYSTHCSSYKEAATANDAAAYTSPTGKVSKAAEIFRFSPELYLSPPVFSPRSSATSGDYQYIATLPPIL